MKQFNVDSMGGPVTIETFIDHLVIKQEDTEPLRMTRSMVILALLAPKFISRDTSIELAPGVSFELFDDQSTGIDFDAEYISLGTCHNEILAFMHDWMDGTIQEEPKTNMQAELVYQYVGKGDRSCPATIISDIVPDDIEFNYNTQLLVDRDFTEEDEIKSLIVMSQKDDDYAALRFSKNEAIELVKYLNTVIPTME